MKSRSVIVFFLHVFVLLFPAPGAEEPRRIMRISLENKSGHVQVRMVERFVERLAARSGNELKIELYDDARLFRDADVVSALSLGKVEMAVPGIWQLDRFAPDFAALMLPSAFGYTEAEAARAVDGPFGAYLSSSLESALPLKVLGRWMELGGAQLFFVGRNVRDTEGLRIRVPGGIANEERMRAFGSYPVAVAWPDLPSFIERGVVDAILTTYETIASAKLHEKGVGAVLEEDQYMAYYVPVLSRRFWSDLDESTRKSIADAWEETVDEARAEAQAAQAAAKRTLAEKGVRIQVASAAERAQKRAVLLGSESEIASRAHVSARAIELAATAFGRR